MRRRADDVRIPGSYQYDALHSGHAVQRFWHRSKQLTIAELLPPSPGDLCLDIGCGSGVISAFLAESGATVIGFDSNPETIAFASAQFSSPRTSFRRGVVDERLEIDRLADKIYCLEVIEHIYPDQALEMLASFRRALKPGGRVLLTTPNYRSMWPIIELGMDALRLAPMMKDHQHVDRYHRRKLRDVFERSDFRIEMERTTCFLSPWVAPISETFAHYVWRMETGFRHGLGSILVIVAQARGT